MQDAAISKETGEPSGYHTQAQLEAELEEMSREVQRLRREKAEAEQNIAMLNQQARVAEAHELTYRRRAGELKMQVVSLQQQVGHGA